MKIERSADLGDDLNAYMSLGQDVGPDEDGFHSDAESEQEQDLGGA